MHPLIPGTSITRRVPVSIILQTLFGGAFTQFGWLFFGFGLMMSLVLVMRSEAVTFIKFRGPLLTTPGVVTATRDTGSSEGGGDSGPGTPIYAITFTFKPQNGTAQMNGTSYRPGTPPAKDETVTVEYCANNPHASRIMGMRSAEFGAASAFALVFPLAGLIIILASTYKRLRLLQIFAIGQPSVGTLAEMESTSVKINGNRVYRMAFPFTTATGEQSFAVMATHRLKPAWQSFKFGPDRGIAPAAMDALRRIPVIGDTIASTVASAVGVQQPATAATPTAPQETVLYDPANPARAMVLAEFGHHACLDAQGNLQGSNPFIGFAAAIIPVLTIAGNIAILYHQFIR